MFTVIKNTVTNIELIFIKVFIETNAHIVEAKRIQEIAVDFKGMSTFCTTILLSLQWVWQILHISLRE
jgi:hypothetical protein